MASFLYADVNMEREDKHISSICVTCDEDP